MSAISPSDHIMIAARNEKIAVSLRLNWVRSYKNFRKPSRKKPSPHGMKMRKGLNNAMMRKTRITKFTKSTARIFDLPTRFRYSIGV